MRHVEIGRRRWPAVARFECASLGRDLVGGGDRVLLGIIDRAAAAVARELRRRELKQSTIGAGATVRIAAALDADHAIEVVGVKPGAIGLPLHDAAEIAERANWSAAAAEIAERRHHMPRARIIRSIAPIEAGIGIRCTISRMISSSERLGNAARKLSIDPMS